MAPSFSVSFFFFFVKYKSLRGAIRRQRGCTQVYIFGLHPGSSDCLQTWLCSDNKKKQKHILHCLQLTVVIEKMKTFLDEGKFVGTVKGEQIHCSD